MVVKIPAIGAWFRLEWGLGMVTWLPTMAGWIGTASYLAAYLLLSIGKLKADRPLYHILNVAGAAGLVYNAIALKDLPNVIVNIAWAIIAFFALGAIGRKK